MDAGQPKKRAQNLQPHLYKAVISSFHVGVKALLRGGAFLEWPDEEGRTPLILACSRGDLYDMVITLLDEGAKLDAYTAGPHGGYPLHHAAKRGLAKVVDLLLSRGANPLAANDDGLTPLDMARNNAHVSVARIIEDRICLFSGMVRELSRPAGFSSATTTTVPQWLTNKVLVYVLPTELDPRKLPRNELVIYQNPRDAVPRTVISLAKAKVEKRRFYYDDPILEITATEKIQRFGFRFVSEHEGDKAQLKRIYEACARGIRQTESGPPAPPTLSSTQVFPQGLQELNRPAAPQLSSSTTASNPTNQSKPTTPTSSVNWTPTGQPNRSSPLPPTEPNPDEIALAMTIIASVESALEEGVPLDYASVAESSDRPSTKQNAEAESGGRCVVCLDAPAEAVCIPCGHLAGCMDCMTEIKSMGLDCPVCRTSIEQVVKVYAV